jgi:hypothetical protein
MSGALYFAGRVLLGLLALVAALWMLGASFAFSRFTGFLVLTIVAIILYCTAPSWVRWLPGVLIFGVLNSLLALVTHRAPTNSQVNVSAWVAGLSIAFYTVGCIVANHYDSAHLSAVDRLALLLYLSCMIWPAFSPNLLATLTPGVAWSTSVGMVALIASFAAHRVRRGRRPINDPTEC